MFQLGYAAALKSYRVFQHSCIHNLSTYHSNEITRLNIIAFMYSLRSCIHHARISSGICMQIFSVLSLFFRPAYSEIR